MTDLITVLSKLVTPKGEILIPGVNELVAPLTEEEKRRYEAIDFGVSDIEEAAGAQIAVSSNKAEVLMGRMRYPSLSIHGIEGAFSAPGAKTVIPAKVSGKFSIRYAPASLLAATAITNTKQLFSFYSLVPNQTPETVDPFVFDFVKSEFAKIGSKNKLAIENLHGGKPWVTDPNHWNYTAAKRATEVRRCVLVYYYFTSILTSWPSR